MKVAIISDDSAPLQPNMLKILKLMTEKHGFGNEFNDFLSEYNKDSMQHHWSIWSSPCRTENGLIAHRD
ncbi:hypothetical protein C9426_34060 [Serratia sp. S1B]|nr:hypothetical protein C9426_34060 [Serratia sp. S1B]